jgi:MoaA/NifB/PqqE/SkfB family radical SAM enzyme
MKLTNIIRRWNQIEALKNGERISPIMVGLHTSNVCNQHCKGCAFTSMHNSSFMNESDHFRLVDDLFKLGVECFEFCGGGEPTVIPYLPKLMRYIASAGKNFALFTNGVLITDDLAITLVEYGTYVRISIEASCKSDYVKYKGVREGEWDKLIGNITKLQELKSAKGSNLEISLKFIVSQTLRGYDHYRRAFDLAKKLGAYQVSIKAARYFSDELTAFDRQAEEEICRKVMEFYKPNCNTAVWIAPYPLRNIAQCWLNPLQFVVDYRGDVSICCYSYWDRQKELQFGNVFQKPLREIWDSEEHWQKVKNIERMNCARVDCKFFKYHETVEFASQRNRVSFI